MQIIFNKSSLSGRSDTVKIDEESEKGFDFFCQNFDFGIYYLDE